ncbi:MAG: hypothetical protein CVV24_07365 [Ignavibacteriae bacterium HGW-Ignavibacteriae-3]|nr:MAG: hypothetical protein CVV24_07365 [Ignavibacteriae bacterium HGW-Ignavibacteriae-3]
MKDPITMQNVKEHNYYKWSVGKGDYVRDEEATISFLRKRMRKKKIKHAIMIVIYLSAVIAVSLLIFGKF